MRILVTGASGFLGWHTRMHLAATTNHTIVPVTRDNWSDLPALIDGCEAVIHLAGVNRAPDQELIQINAELAHQLAEAVSANETVRKVIYANTIHANEDTPYGQGKAAASKVIKTMACRLNRQFVDLNLPNLFGEHGKPGYNSFVATFSDFLARDQWPEDITDGPISLLHVQDAASIIASSIHNARPPTSYPTTNTTVMQVLMLLASFREVYKTGDIPHLTTSFQRRLFSTLRAALWQYHPTVPIQLHADKRGRLFEAARSHGGADQTFVSTTKPGVTRGDHYHLRKMERFIVINGSARISLRKFDSPKVLTFDVTGESPVAIDMPIGWAHNIQNTGNNDLITLFWTDELFDPRDTDTYFEQV